MLTRSRILLIGFATIVVLAAAIGTASANRLSASDMRWRYVYTPIRFIAGSHTVSCNLTLEGSFHSAVSQKVAGALSGFVTRAVVATCTDGSASVLNETLPWHVQYTSFTGTLPRISSVQQKLIGTSFQVQPTGNLVCLSRMESAHPGRSLANIEANGRITSITAEPLAGIPLTGSGGLCAFAGEGHFEGAGTVTRLGSTTSLTVRLI